MNSNGSKKSRKWLFLAAILVLGSIAVLCLRHPGTAASDEFGRLSQLGKSHLENGKPKEGLAAFQRALELNPTQIDGRYNLALAFLRDGQNEKAIANAQTVLEADHNAAGAWYVMGLAHLHLGHYEQAVQALTQAKNLDVSVNPVAFQLGLAYEGWGRLDEAIGEWQTLTQFEPDHPGASYRLSMALRRAGKTAEADAAMEQHAKNLAKRGGQGARPETLEQCKYLVARVPFRLEQPAKNGIKVAFIDATAQALGDAAKYRAPLGVIDFAQDGRNHLMVGEGGSGFRLLVNSNGIFRPQGNLWPGVPDSKYTRCLVGDLNNDGAPDALMLGDKGVKLFKFATNGTVNDATMFAGLGKVAAVEGALVDLDFRGNLDLMTVSPGGQGARFLRNLGNMYFTDCTPTSGIPANLAGLRQVVIEDWNGDDVQDVVMAREDLPPVLLLKMRGGSLLSTNPPPAWPAGHLIACADLNNDLKPDLVVCDSNKVYVLIADDPRPVVLPADGLHPSVLQLTDFDNDGWLDVVAGGQGLRVWRNLGSAGFLNVTRWLGLDNASLNGITALAAADFDNDGDTDLAVASAAGLKMLRNEGGNANLLFKVHLLGRRSNASGLGIRLELNSAGLRLGRRVQSLPVEIGVGSHAQLESVNARWFNTSPSYVDVKVDPRLPLQLEEIAIQEGSCPYLYAWNGERFRFVTDILGAGALGLPVAQGRLVEADPDEMVWVGQDHNFKPRQGQYVLQITEELREVLYLDHVRLVVAEHPANTEVHSTSKLLPGPPYPKPELVTLGQQYVLIKAHRTTGEDVTEALAAADGRFVSPPKLRVPQLRGLAESHGYVLDFGPLDHSRPLVLALTGWLRLGGGMANIAASQYPNLPFPFPLLEVETGSGDWQPVDTTVGAPSGKTKTIVVDLTNKLPRQARRFRLISAYELHWDRIALFERMPSPATRLIEIEASSADLHWRGFSRPANTPWFEPITPVYETVVPRTVLDILPSGWCTRYGRADDLVRARDGALVLINGGDELTIRFPALADPLPSPAVRRDYFLYGCGWDKDSDFHVTAGSSVEPLPWHGMDYQLYGRQSRPALAGDAWIKTFNSRWVGPRFLSRKR